MTTTTQIAQGAAPFAIAGCTLAAPVLAKDEAPRVRSDIGRMDFTAPTAAGARAILQRRRVTEIRGNDDNDSGRKTAEQLQSFVTELQNVYARIDVRHNPALAALGANIAQLAERATTR